MSDNKGKKIPQSNIFDGVFSDSDDDNEIKTDYVEEEIIYRVQEKHENVLRAFKEFMDTPEYITGKGDPNTNVVDRYCMVGDNITARTYNMPIHKIDKMFKFLEVCRRKDLKMMVYEKQLEMSGLMIDFDIFQDTEECRFNDGLGHSALLSTVKLIWDHIDFSPVLQNGKYTLHIAIIKKPRVMYNSDKQCFKDGLHILIPGLKLNRETKRFLLNRAIEEEYYKDMFRQYPSIKGLSFADFIDKNSAHVPVHFLGSVTKIGNPPYYLFGVYKYHIYPGEDEMSTVISKCEEFEPKNLDSGCVNSNIVAVHELSLNWEKEGGIIKKQNFYLKEEYLLTANKYKSGINSRDDDEKTLNNENGEISLLKMHDPDVEYIVNLLDTLHISRAVDYTKWFKVICMLANTSKSYKPLAEHFSKRCPEKFSKENFERYWNEACASKENRITLGSLHHWAKEDNPDRYESLRSTGIFDLIFKKIYDPQMEGHLQHYDIAQLLFKSLRHKYVYDNSGKGTWYEFVLPEEPHRKGQVYKWRAGDRPPFSIKRYVSELLPILFRKIHDKISSVIENLKSDKEMNYHLIVKKNFQISTRNLKHAAYKNGVASEAEQVFEKVGFTDELDKDPEILGVGNGILVLGKECSLVTGYHNYLITQFTATDYITFNPREIITKKLLIALRNLFPDDEPDTFDFMMHYLASALDGKKKESLLLLLVGNGSNGKSFLIELFRETIGQQFVVKMPLAFLTSRQKNSESATPALMMLMNARMATYSETEKAEVLHSAKIKEVTGQETLGGRKNFGDFVNFKPTCHHIVTSNYDFEVNSTDHGTWRRLKRVAMKIKFCKKNVDNYDPSNPYERLADPSLGSSWPDDPEVRSAFLSILTYYYESLQRNYNGLVENIPHPTIKNETELFRNRQDKINRFINIRIVKTVGPYVKTPMSIIIEKYSRWHDSLYPDDRDYKKSVILQFENSRLNKVIVKSRVENFIKGYRVLDNNEALEEGETYFMDNFMERSDKKNIKLTPESSEQFYERLCKEFDLYTKDKKAAFELEQSRRRLLAKEIQSFEDLENSKILEKDSNLNNKSNEKSYENSNKKYDVEKKYDNSGYRITNELILDEEFQEFIKDSDNDSGNESSYNSGNESDYSSSED